MSAAAKEVRKALLKLAQSWPRDPLRTNLNFGEAVRRATEAELHDTCSRASIAEARRSLSALERIRSDASLREYPTPRNILQPASAPRYYARLIDAMNRIARGQSVSPSLTERMRHFFGRAP
ncbi:acetylornithine transaminase [Malassezia sp. CBS 17886]|nr:acetylornithine transaminase [Malassezia sp. CBS 17886]